MHAFFRLSVISLLAVAALSNAQAPNLSPQQQILNNAVAALASLQAQIPNNIAALQRLASSGILGRNAQLASQTSNLIAQLQALPQLVRAENAALLQSKLPTSPSPAIPSAPASAPPPGASNPASLQNQCDAIQAQLQIYTAVQATPQNYVTARGAAPVFLKSVREVQSAFSSCKGVDNTGGACQAVNELVAQLQGYVILFTELSATTPNPSNAAQNGVIVSRVAGSAGVVLGLIAKVKTALKCP